MVKNSIDTTNYDTGSRAGQAAALEADGASKPTTNRSMSMEEASARILASSHDANPQTRAAAANMR